VEWEVAKGLAVEVEVGLMVATSAGQAALQAALAGLIAALAALAGLIAALAALAGLIAALAAPVGLTADPVDRADRVAPVDGAGIPAFLAATTEMAGDRRRPIWGGGALTRADTTTSRSTTTAPG
jgi:hypothetical protein